MSLMKGVYVAIRMLKIGEKVPDVTFHVKAGAGFQKVLSREIFSGQQVLVLGVPGVFVTDYPSSMVQGYEFHYSKFKALGIDEIYFTSTNDSYVMSAWFHAEKIVNIKPLPDGNADWAEGVGFHVDMKTSGMGLRSHRYAMFVEDGVLKKVFYEDFSHDPHTCFTETNAEKILDFLRANQHTWLQFGSSKREVSK